MDLYPDVGCEPGMFSKCRVTTTDLLSSSPSRCPPLLPEALLLLSEFLDAHTLLRPRLFMCPSCSVTCSQLTASTHLKSLTCWLEGLNFCPCSHDFDSAFKIQNVSGCNLIHLVASESRNGPTTPHGPTASHDPTAPHGLQILIVLQILMALQPLMAQQSLMTLQLLMTLQPPLKEGRGRHWSLLSAIFFFFNIILLDMLNSRSDFLLLYTQVIWCRKSCQNTHLQKLEISL